MVQVRYAVVAAFQAATFVCLVHPWKPRLHDGTGEHGDWGYNLGRKGIRTHRVNAAVSGDEQAVQTAEYPERDCGWDQGQAQA